MISPSSQNLRETTKDQKDNSPEQSVDLKEARDRIAKIAGRGSPALNDYTILVDPGGWLRSTLQKDGQECEKAIRGAVAQIHNHLHFTTRPCDPEIRSVLEHILPPSILASVAEPNDNHSLDSLKTYMSVLGALAPEAAVETFLSAKQRFKESSVIECLRIELAEVIPKNDRVLHVLREKDDLEGHKVICSMRMAEILELSPSLACYAIQERLKIQSVDTCVEELRRNFSNEGLQRGLPGVLVAIDDALLQREFVSAKRVKHYVVDRYKELIDSASITTRNETTALHYFVETILNFPDLALAVAAEFRRSDLSVATEAGRNRLRNFLLNPISHNEFSQQAYKISAHSIFTTSEGAAIRKTLSLIGPLAKKHLGEMLQEIDLRTFEEGRMLPILLAALIVKENDTAGNHNKNGLPLRSFFSAFGECMEQAPDSPIICNAYNAITSAYLRQFTPSDIHHALTELRSAEEVFGALSAWDAITAIAGPQEEWIRDITSHLLNTPLYFPPPFTAGRSPDPAVRFEFGLNNPLGFGILALTLERCDPEWALQRVEAGVEDPEVARALGYSPRILDSICTLAYRKIPFVERTISDDSLSPLFNTAFKLRIDDSKLPPEMRRMHATLEEILVKIFRTKTPYVDLAVVNERISDPAATKANLLKNAAQLEKALPSASPSGRYDRNEIEKLHRIASTLAKAINTHQRVLSLHTQLSDLLEPRQISGNGATPRSNIVKFLSQRSKQKITRNIQVQPVIRGDFEEPLAVRLGSKIKQIHPEPRTRGNVAKITAGIIAVAGIAGAGERLLSAHRSSPSALNLSNLQLPKNLAAGAEQPSAKTTVARLSKQLHGQSQYFVSHLTGPSLNAEQPSLREVAPRTADRIADIILENRHLQDHSTPNEPGCSMQFTAMPGVEIPLPLGAQVISSSSEIGVRYTPDGMYLPEVQHPTEMSVTFRVPESDPVLDPAVTISEIQQRLGLEHSILWTPRLSAETFAALAPELAEIVRTAKERPLAEAVSLICDAVRASMPYEYHPQYGDLKDGSAQEYLSAILATRKGICRQFALLEDECFKQAGIPSMNAICYCADDEEITNKNAHVATMTVGADRATGKLVPYISDATGSTPIQLSEPTEKWVPGYGSASLILLALGGAAAAVAHRRHKDIQKFVFTWDEAASDNTSPTTPSAAPGSFINQAPFQRMFLTGHKHPAYNLEKVRESWIRSATSAILEEIEQKQPSNDDADSLLALLPTATQHLDAWIKDSRERVMNLIDKLEMPASHSHADIMSLWLRSVQNDSAALTWVKHIRDGLRTTVLAPHEGIRLLNAALDCLPEPARHEALNTLQEFIQPLRPHGPRTELSDAAFAYSFGGKG